MRNDVVEIKEALTGVLRDVLPGEEAHRLLEPSTRKNFRSQPRRNARHSSVLILIYPRENKLRTITILRPQYDGVHSGQISFPGGQYEKEDYTLLETALRETREEIGVDVKEEQVAGKLTDIYIPPSNFLVTPYVALIKEVPQMKKDSFEVEKLIEVDLENIIRPDAILRRNIHLEKYGNIHVPCFIVDDQIIWGATAMIISELRTVLGRVLK
jgi:8-oxo-dGTP pyrophosphatase MutT (NUDIX family)